MPALPERMARIPFITVLIAIFGVGMVGLLVVNTSLQNQAFESRALNRQAAQLVYAEAELQSQLNQVRSPGADRGEGVGAGHAGESVPGLPGRALRQGDRRAAPDQGRRDEGSDRQDPRPAGGGEGGPRGQAKAKAAAEAAKQKAKAEAAQKKAAEKAAAEAAKQRAVADAAARKAAADAAAKQKAAADAAAKQKAAEAAKKKSQQGGGN